MKLHLPKVLLTALMTTIVGLSPYAAGETVSVDLLDSDNIGTWKHNSNNNAPENITLVGGGTQSYTYNFEQALCATDEQNLTFSLTMSVKDSTWGGGSNPYNFLTAVTFGGSTGAFAVGKFDYATDKSLSYAWGGNGNTQAFINGTGKYDSLNTTQATNKGILAAETPYYVSDDDPILFTIGGTLASDKDGTYTLTLTYDGASYTVDMGVVDDINRIVFYNDGSKQAQITALTLTGASAQAASYIWSGTTNANTWSTTSGGVWYSGTSKTTARTTARDTVTFDESGEEKVVAIDDTVVARDLIVEDNYTFQGSTASDNVTAVNDLSIAADKTLQLSGEGTLNAKTVSGEGALVLSDGSLWTTASAAVLDAVTGKGDVAISGLINLVNGQSISNTGKVIIGTGADLRLGYNNTTGGDTGTYSIGLSNSGFELAGGQLFTRGFAGNLGDIDVTADSTLWIADIANVNQKTSIDTLTINEGKTLNLDTNWKGRIEVAKLTGAGNVTFGALKDDSAGRILTVKSVDGYTGHFTIENMNGNPATLNLTVKANESFNASQLTACDKSTVVIDGAGTYNMGKQLYIAKAGEAEKGSFATTWTGTTSFSDATFNGTDLNKYGNANSTVSFKSGNTGTLATGTINTNIVLASDNASCFDWKTVTNANVNFAGKISGKGNMGVAKNSGSGNGHQITFSGDVSGWGGVFWAAAKATIIYTDNAKVVNNALRIGEHAEATYKFQNIDGITVNSTIHKDSWSRGVLNLVVENKEDATGEVTFNGQIYTGTANGGAATTNLLVDSGASAVFTHAETKFNKIEVKSDAHLSFTNEDKQANVASATFDGGILETKTQALKVSGVTTVTAQGATLKGSLEAVGGVQLKDSSDTLAASISGIATNTNATLTNVTLSNTGIDAVEGTQGSITNALVELQQNSAFSIADVTMTNVEISAAEVSTPVLLQPVKAHNVSLTKGTFVTEATLTAEDVPKTESGSTSYAYSTGALSGITLNNAEQSANIVLNLGGMGDFAQNAMGICDISITLTGFSVKAVDIKGIYFAADSWLGRLLAAQDADAYVKDSILSVAQVYNLTNSASGSTNVSVSFETSGSDTVITIEGLDMVPEPTTTTLSLLALTALAARRRRK